MPKMRLSKTLLAAAAFSVAPVLPAANLYWDGGTSGGTGDGASAGGAGTWNTTTSQNWDQGAGLARTAWINGANVAEFGGTPGTGIVTLGSAITAGGLNFTTSGYTVTSNTLTLNGIINTDTGVTATVSSTLAGSGSVTKSGAGTLTLTAVNTYTGGTTVSGGTLLVNGAGGNGRIKGGITVNSGATLRTTGDGTGLGYNNQVTSLVINGGLVESAAGAGTHIWNITGGITMTGGTLQTNGGVSTTTGDRLEWNRTNLTTLASTQSAVIAGRINIRTDNSYSAIQMDVADGAVANDLLITAAITSSGAGITKAGAGTLTLTGANTYSGATTISAGTLQVGAGGTSGTLGTGAVTNNAALVFNRSDSFSVSNSISGTGTVTNAGTGSLTLTAANAYTGGTTVTAGTLVASATGALGSGAVTVTGGKLVAASSGAIGSGAVTVNTGGTLEVANAGALPSVTLAGGTLSLAVQGLNFGTISGGALSTATPASTSFSSDFSPLHATSGQGALGTNTTAAYTGKIYLTAGTWAFGENFDDGARVVVNGQVLVNDGTWNNPTSGAITIATDGWYDIDVRAWNGGGGTGSAGGSWVGKGVGVRAGGATTDGALFAAFGPAAAGVKLSAPGIATATTAVTLAADSTIEAQDLLGTGVSGTNLTGVVSGAGKLTTTGGILVLSGNNTYTGATEVASGTLRLGNANALGTTAAGTTVMAGATLDLNGQTIGTESLTLNGAGVGGAGALVNSSASTATWNGAVSLASDTSVGGAGKIILGGVVSGGKLIKIGTGELELSNPANNYTGGTDIQSGTLTVRGLNSTGTGPVTIGAAGTFAVNATGTVNITGAITGAGSFEQKGGTTVLTGSNTYLGVTKISGGTLQVGNGGTTGSLGAGDVQFTGNGTLAFNRSDTVTFDKKITGTQGTLSQINPTGTLVVTGDNSGFSGAVAVTAGTLQLGATGGTSGSLGTGTVTVSSGAHLVLARADAYELGNAFAGTGTADITQTQGTAVLTRNNTFSGAWKITGGTLQVGGTAAGVSGTTGNLGTGTVDIGAAGKLVLNNSGALTLAQALSGTGRIEVKAGTVTLANANTAFSGRIQVGQGATLEVKNDGTAAFAGGLGTNSTVVTDGTLTFINDVAGTVQTSIQGAGGVTIQGLAATTFSLANSYQGTTTINSELDLSGQGSLGSGAVVNNGTLVLKRTDTHTISNGISGSGTLIQESGTAILTGSNTYTGQTMVVGGTLQIGAGGTVNALASTSPVQLSSGSRLLFNLSGGAVDNTFVDDPAAPGGAIIEKAGSGTLTFRNANLVGFTGALKVTSGTAAFGTGAQIPLNATVDIASGAKLNLANYAGTVVSFAALTGSGELALGSVAYTTGGNSTFAGKISGAGGLTVSAGHTLSLAGASTFTGAATVNTGGRLVLSDGGSFATSQVTVAGGAFLDFDRTAASPATFGSAVSGGGTVRALGAGLTTLTGVVSGVAIENAGAGTLTLTAAGSLTSVLSSAGVTDITTTGIATVDSVQVNAGALTLRTRAVAGTTTVAGGQATFAGELQGDVTVSAGTLYAGAGVSDTTSRISAPVVDVSGPGKLVLNSDSSYTLAHLTGNGTLEAAGGANSVVTLQADPTFTGVVTLSAGVIRITTDADLGTPADVRFNTGTLDVTSSAPVTFANTVTAVDGTLSYLNVNGNVSFTSLQGTGAIRVRGAAANDIIRPGFAGQVIGDGDTLDLKGVNFSATNFTDNIGIKNTSGTAATFTVNQKQDGVLSGVIGADGGDNLGLVKTGTGVLTLTGTNTYTGATTISGGTLRIGDNSVGGSGSLGTGGAVSVSRGATLEFNRADALAVDNRITGAGTLAQNGAGVLTLSAPAGIDIGSLTGTGAIQLSTALTVGAGNYAGALSGTGSLTKNDVGTLVLSGDNSAYAGNVALDSGVIQVGVGGGTGSLGTGSLVNKGKLVFNRDGALTVATAISGTGDLEVNGAATGRVIFTGNNQYQGKTTITKGTLQVGAGGTGGSLGSGAVAIASGSAVEFNRANAVTLYNVITGAGDFRQTGAGALTLRGVYGLTGATTVTGSGSLILDRAAVATSYAGDFTVSGGSTLVFKGSSNATLAKSLSGTGTVVFSGATGATSAAEDTTSKATVLSADSANFTGSIVVQKGHTLKLGASSTSARPSLGASLLTVDAGAALRGSGRVAGSIKSAGTIAPGHSPGLLQVGTDFTSTGTLAMEIRGGDTVPGSGDGAGVRYDQVQFGGTATLGGTLALSVSGLSSGDMVTLLKDTAPVSGSSSFSGAFVNITGVTTGRLITTNSEILFFNANSLGDLAGVSLHDGVAAFASALTPTSGVSHKRFADFRAAYTTSGAAALARELQNASPVGLASLTAMPVAQATRDADDLRRRAESQALSRDTLYGDAADWVTYVGASGATLDHDTGASSPVFDTRTYGGVVGLERRLGDESGAAVGLRLGYDRGTATMHQGGGKADQDHARATLYGITMMGDDAYLSAGFGMGYSTFETKRNTLAGTQKASPTGWDVSGAVDAGFLWKLDRAWVLAPHAGLGFVSAKVGGFTEKGSDLALSVDGYSQTSLYTRVGTGLYREWATRNYSRDSLRLGVDIAYEHELLDDTVDISASFSSFQQAGGFTSAAPVSVRDRLVIGPQAEWMFDEARSISAGYRAQIGFDGSIGHRFDITFEQRF